MPDTTARAPASEQDFSNRLATVSLDDKYTAKSGNIFLSGIQALVRLPMIQRERDEAAGLNTAGFISGYRGSPSAASMKRCGKPRATSTPTTSNSSPASTKTSPPPPCGAPRPST